MTDKRSKAEKLLDRHRDDIVRVLGAEFRSDKRYLRMVDEVAGGRTALNVVLDLTESSAHHKSGW